MAGETVACGAAHPDNVAPSLYGGFVLARTVDPPDIVRLPVPDGAVVRARCIRTSRWRPGQRAGDARRHAFRCATPSASGRMSARWSPGCSGTIWRSIGARARGSRRRAAARASGARLCRGKQRRSTAGALGCSLSGSGPSMFALCATPRAAPRPAAAAMRDGVYRTRAAVRRRPVDLGGRRRPARAAGVAL